VSLRDDGVQNSVLAPRSTPISKNSTWKTTSIGNDARHHHSSGSLSGSSAVRMNGAGSIGREPKPRETVMNMKNSGGWRY